MRAPELGDRRVELGDEAEASRSRSRGVRYSTGQLYDRTVTGQLRVWDRGNSGSGHGWTGAWVVFWNAVSTSGDVVVASPPGAANFGVGVVALATSGDGAWDSPGLRVFPSSLYLAQRSARTGAPYFECAAWVTPPPTPAPIVSSAGMDCSPGSSTCGDLACVCAARRLRHLLFGHFVGVCTCQ